MRLQEYGSKYRALAGRPVADAGSVRVDVPCQDFALADAVGGADDAFLLHPLDDPRRAVVADLQVALDEAGRGLALAADDRNGLVVERVAAAAALLGIEVRSGLVVLAR